MCCEADARSACSKLRGTPTPFQCAIVPAGDISAANFRSEKFGTVSLYKQLSGKLSDLPVTATYDVWERYASPLEAAWRCRLLAHHVIRCAAIFRTLSDNNGQRLARRLNRYATIDPHRTSPLPRVVLYDRMRRSRSLKSLEKGNVNASRPARVGGVDIVHGSSIQL
jgi:hypothetical protein